MLNKQKLLKILEELQTDLNQLILLDDKSVLKEHILDLSSFIDSVLVSDPEHNDVEEDIDDEEDVEDVSDVIEMFK